MKTYLVKVRCESISTVEVTGENIEEALKKAQDGMVDYSNEVIDYNPGYLFNQISEHDLEEKQYPPEE